MMLTTALVGRCQARGLAVVEMSGWLGRGESGSFTPRGVLLHHDGMGLGNNNVPNYMSQDGVNGSQLWIHKNGSVYFLAAGLKWHAGVGPGWGCIPSNQGNAYCVGIETDHTDGQEWTAPQLDSMVVLAQEIVAEYGIDVDEWCCGHREYAPGRKNDPESYDLDAWRCAIKAGSSPTPPPPPPPPPPKEWDEMATKAEFTDAVYAVVTRPDVVDNLANAVMKKLAADDWFGPDARRKLTGEITEAVMGRGGKVNGYYPADVLGVLYDHVTGPKPTTYVVAAGDTLTSIAAKFGVTVAELETWNNVDPNNLSIGVTLKVTA